MVDNQNPLQILYESLKRDNYDVPDNYESFERTLTADTNARRTLYNSLMRDNYDVPDNYESFDNTLFGSDATTVAQGLAVNPYTMQQPAQPQGSYNYGGMDIAGVRKPQKSPKQMQQEAEAKTTSNQPSQPTRQELFQREMEGQQFEQAIGNAENAYSSFLDNIRKKQQPFGNNQIDAMAPARQQRMHEEQKYTTRVQLDELKGDIDKRIADIQREAIADWRARDEKRSFWENAARSLAGTPAMSGSVAEETARMYEEHPELRELTAASRSLKNAEQVIAEADHNAKEGTFESSWFAGLGRGFGQKLSDVNTWDMGITSVQDNSAILKALEAFDRGEPLTESQQALLDAKAIELCVNEYFGSEVGRGYKAGATTAEAIPFMVEMVANPLSSVGKGATKMMAKYAVKRFGKKAAKKFGSKLFRGSIRGIADVISAGGMTATTGGINTYAGALDRMIGDMKYDTDENGNIVFAGHENMEDPLSALGKEFSSQTIERWSEMAGVYNEFIPKVLGKLMGKGFNKIGLGAVTRFFERVPKTQWGKTIGNFMERTQWHGPIGEFFEEIEGGTANALMHIDQTLDANPETGVFNKDNLIDTFEGVAVMGVMFAGAGTVGYIRGRAKLHQADKRAELLFGNYWPEIRDLMTNGSYADRHAIMEKVLSDPTSSEEQKRAMLDYDKWMLANAMRENVTDRVYSDPSEMAAGVSFDNGYFDYDTDEKRQDAYVDLGLKEESIRKMLGDETFERLENAPIDVQRELEQGGNLTDEQRQAIADYVATKYAIEGIEQRINDDADNIVSQEREAFNLQRNDDDGALHPATMNVDGGQREVYIKSGNVALDASGEIDDANSEETIVVYDPVQGKNVMISPQNLIGVGNVTTMEQFEEGLSAQREAYIQQQMDAATGRFNPQPGQQIDMPDGTKAQVLATDGTNVVVQMPDGTQQEQPIAEVQRIADELAMRDYAERHPQEHQPTADQPVNEPAAETPTDGKPSATDYLPKESGVDAPLEVDTWVVLKDDNGVPVEEGRITRRMRLSTDGTQRIDDPNGNWIEYEVNGETKLMQVGDMQNSLYSYAPAKVEEPVAEAEPVQEEPAQEQPTAEETVPAGESAETAAAPAETEQPQEELTPEQQMYNTIAQKEGANTGNKVEKTVKYYNDEEVKAKNKLEAAKQKLADAPIGVKEQQAEQQLAKAQRDYDKAVENRKFWNKVMIVHSDAMAAERARQEEERRQRMEEIRAQEEARRQAEEQRLAAERAEAERRRAEELERESRMRPMQEAEDEIFNNVWNELQAENDKQATDRKQALLEKTTPNAKRALARQLYGEYYDDNLETPASIEELVAAELIKKDESQRINWDMVNGKFGIQQELGSNMSRSGGRKNRGDFAGFQSVISFNNNGVSFQQAAHNIWESELNALPNGERRYDDGQIRDAMIDMLLSAGSVDDIRNYAFNHRIEAAENAISARERDAVSRAVEWQVEQSGMTFAEYVAWYADMKERADAVADMTEEEYYNTLNNIDYEPRTEETAGRVPAERTGESGNDGRGEETGAGEVRGQEGERAGTGENAERGDEETAGGEGAAEEQPAVSEQQDIAKQKDVPAAPTEEQKTLTKGLVGWLNDIGINTHAAVRKGQEVLNKYRELVRALRGYHGSAADFEHFDKKYRGSGVSAGRFGAGWYVTKLNGRAKGYAVNQAHSKGGNPIVYEVEIPDDNGSNYLDWFVTIPKKERRRIAEAIRNIPERYLDRARHGNNWLPGGFGQLAGIIEREQTGGSDLYERLYDSTTNDFPILDFLSSLGYVGTRYHEWSRPNDTEYVVYNDNDIKIVNKIRFQRAADGEYEPKPTFYSNAMNAVEGIKQEKATAEQWLAMLQKNGGLKAGEDKWIGLSDWLNEHKGKSLTKQEVMDYIRENQIQVEEQHYGNGLNGEAREKLDEFNEEFKEYVAEYSADEFAESELETFEQEMLDKYGQGWVDEIDGNEQRRYDELVERVERYQEPADAAFKTMVARYGDDFGFAFEVDDYSRNPRIIPQEDYNDNISDAAMFFLGMKDGAERPINETRLQYTTDFLDNKREIALTIPTIEPWNENDNIHFGDAGDGRAVAWVRFGETTDAEGNRVLVIDEIQSKRHQEGREKGYKKDSDAAEAKRLLDASVKAQDEYDAYMTQMSRKYGVSTIAFADVYSNMSDPEQQEADRLEQVVYEADDAYQNFNPSGIPDAPFDKNWHEVAFKRMLRYAAENGFDKVAWTTGEQQAERYDLGKELDILSIRRNADGTYNVEGRRKGDVSHQLERFESNVPEDKLANIVGKDVAKRAIENKGIRFELKGEGLRIGGEGMKGFYDQILPRFMNKYGKKWGVEVGEVELPNIGDNGLTMHSVDVTPEMKASVLQGQPMFFRDKDGEVIGYTLNGEIYIDPRYAKPETPVHEYTHLIVHAIRTNNPQVWERWKELAHGEQDVIDFVKAKYPEYSENEDDFWEEVISNYTGREGGKRLEDEMRRQMRETPDIAEKARIATIFHKLRDLLRRFWDMTKDIFSGSTKGIDNFQSMDDVVDLTLAALANKFDPRAAQERARDARDREYLDAVERGDMETAQRMVDEAAREAGYTANDDYKDGHHAPGASVDRKDFQNLEAIRETVENDSAASNLFAMAQGVSLVPDDYFSANGPRWYAYQNWTGGMEAYYNLRNVINDIQRQVREFGEVKNMPTIKVYRAVPKDIKAGQLESGGQWVSPSREYAVNHGKARFGFGKYRVIEQNVRADELWFDGNDIREWGFDDDTQNAYQNTKNNRKSLDAVTYDDNGNVIPLSQRFNKRNADIRFQKAKAEDITSEENIAHGLDALQQLADGAEEVRGAMKRKDLAQHGGDENITFYFGKEGDASKDYKKGYGIAHIGAKHGKDAIIRAINIIANGQFERYNEGNKTVVLTDGEYETVLALTRFGNKETWLFNGWKKKENTGDNGEVSTASVSTQNSPTFSRADLGAVVSAAKVQQNSETAKNNLQNAENENGEQAENENALMREGDDIPFSGKTYEEALAEAKAAGYTKKQFDAMIERSERNARKQFADWAEKLHLTDRITFVDNIDEVEGLTDEQREQRRDKKGWYDRRNGRIVILLDNHHGKDDVLQTILHEGVAHHGLRALFGKHFDDFLDNVYAAAEYPIREQIAKLAKNHGWNIRTATEEYLATLAESTEFENIENSPLAGWWTKIKQFFLDMLHKLGIKDAFENAVAVFSDNELRYILWSSYQNLVNPGRYRSFVDTATDVVVQDKLKVGNFAEDNGERGEWYMPSKAAEGDDVMFREGEDVDDVMNDRTMGMKERMTAVATSLAEKNKDDVNLKNAAYRAIGGNLADLRKAMGIQKEFDKGTVKRVADLARVLLAGGYLDGATNGEMSRILSAVKNSTGKADISGDIRKIMDIMINSQLRRAEEALKAMEKVKASKVNAAGVEVQGSLDIRGQNILKTFKDTRGWPEDEIRQAMAEAENRMASDDDAVADEATAEYFGLQLALDYEQNIHGSVIEERQLRQELADARSATDRSMEFENTILEALEQNKVERIQAYHNLMERLGNSIRGSIERAKEFKEAEKERVREIQHNANSDMEGRPSKEHYKPKFMDKFVNNSFVQFFFQPLATFDQMLRLLGSKSANGEGYLYNRFMRGWVDAREKELRGVRSKYAELDEKVKQLFGRDAKSMGELIRRIGRMPKMKVEFWDGGEMKEHTLTQGNLMYIYMVNKMLDGRMKLRKMGIDEKTVDTITRNIDPRLLELADWMQNEFLVNTRNEYNATHQRVFGASMAAIEDYFPLKILANARVDKPEDVDNFDLNEGISTKTGSIIKRRRNALALDLLNADALNVILDHVAQMEHWNAFAEFNRDLNTLRTYKRFRNQVKNMRTIYGSGDTLWQKFNDLSQLVAGTYRPKRANLDVAASNFAKGVTAAKVSFRIFTALKQFLSMPAYIPDARPDLWAKNLATPWKSWSWAMENLPIFEERWKGRMAGDPRLLKSELDWKAWRNNVVQLASKVGMSPNAFVDALTVSIGARTIYETRKARYLKEGYNEEQADRKAKQDAEIAYNQTQQSSEGAFLSTMQVDRSWLSVMFTVFRNSSLAYQRQLHDAIRNLKRDLKKGNREQSIEFMAKQMMREGVSEEKAQKAAEARYNRQIGKDALRVATFGFVLQFFWNLGAKLPYLLFGDDDDKKKEMMDDVLAQSMFGWSEGLTGGDMLSQGGKMLVQGEGNPEYLMKEMPIASDMKDVLQEIGQGKYGEVVNDMVNLAVQAGIGVNPQSITDAVLAIMDACGDDPALAHEATIAVMRILQVPQSQIKEMYFDEVGLSGSEVSNYTPQQLAERYAQYQVKRGRLLAPWTWDDEANLDKQRKKAEKEIKERVGNITKEYNDLYDEYKAAAKETGDRINEAYNEAKQENDYVKKAEIIANVRTADEKAYRTYEDFKKYDKMLDDIAKKYLAATTPEQAALAKDDLVGFKSRMVELLGEDDEKQRRKLYFQLNEYYSDFKKEYDDAGVKE